MDYKQSILIILVVSLVTITLRFLPFLVFKGDKESPKIISYLANVLPFAIMGMLVVYCLKNVSFLSEPFGLPEIIAILVVVILHIWKKNTLVSIVVGTVVYMLLVQIVFI